MIVDAAIERYLLSLAPERSRIQRTIENDPPAAIVGPLEGHFLYLLAKINDSRRILEIGTATGYSTLWLARALPPDDGHIVTIERDPGRAATARANFVSAGYGERIEVREGDAFAVLPPLEDRFDFIFVDILRNLSRAEEAPQLYEICLSLLQPAGLLVADNVLVDAQVIMPNPAPRVQGILEWNRRVAGEMEATILPLRDGIAIGRKTNY